MKNCTENDYFKDSKPFQNIICKMPDLFNKSEEVYFGNNAPLRLLLLDLATYLKQKITKETEYTKSVIDDIKRTCKLYGNNIAKEINAESVDIYLSLDKDPNAWAYNMLIDNNTIKDENNKTVISYDKIYDMETIIKTTTGYQFKNKKNKLILIGFTSGLIIDHDIDSIAAVFAHEIGHTFELGIFGTLKVMSDKMYGDIIYNTKSRLNEIDGKFKLGFSLNPSLIPFNVLTKGILNYIFSFLFYPSLLKGGIFSKLNIFFTKFFNFTKEKTARISDDINGKKADNVAVAIEYDRKKEIQKTKEYIEESYKDYKKSKEKNFDGKKSLSFHLFNLLVTIRSQIYMFDMNVLETITLSSYTLQTYEKTSHIRKYENFADIFATSYGFGSSVAKFVSKIDRESIGNPIEEFTPLYKLPIINLFMYSNILFYNKKKNYNTEYGNYDHRIENLYKSLYFELKNNKELTIQQKIDIKENMDQIKSIHEQVKKDKRVYGFIINFIDKMVSKKLKKKYNDNDIIMDILEPMESVLTKEEFEEKELDKKTK